MSVERAVQHAIASETALVRATADAVPKAWGALAARGVLVFREMNGRAPTEDERRAIWSGLWDAVRRTHAHATAGTCGHEIDPAHHAVCDVCRGMRLCMDCARTHLCTSACASRGCQPGLCVKEVRGGVVAEVFGLT